MMDTKDYTFPLAIFKKPNPQKKVISQVWVDLSPARPSEEIPPLHKTSLYLTSLNLQTLNNFLFFIKTNVVLCLTKDLPTVD